MRNAFADMAQERGFTASHVHGATGVVRAVDMVRGDLAIEAVELGAVGAGSVMIGTKFRGGKWSHERQVCTLEEFVGRLDVVGSEAVTA